MSDPATRWSEALAAWAIPDEILRRAPMSPYGFPVEVFERAADHARDRETPSRRRALEALGDGGTVLDVGCGAGAAGLALAPRAMLVTGVDESAAMLEAFARKAAERGVRQASVEGRWPDVAEEVEVADVVVCHHVLYNVPDFAGFATALDRHARRLVVVELTLEHPLAWMNDLWRELWGIERPGRPVLEDAIAVLHALGIQARSERWTGPFRLHEAGADALVAFVRTRLCLTEDRDGDIRAALERHPVPARRSLATLWWMPSGQ